MMAQFFLALMFVTAPSERHIAVLVPDASIVIGRVKHVLPQGEQWMATVQVTRVLCGDSFRVDDEFTAETAHKPRNFDGRPVVIPRLGKSEVAVWYVGRGEDQFHLARRPEMHLNWPVRNPGSPEFEAAVHLGEQMQSVSEVPGLAAGIARLTELVADPYPETSCWAVTKLAELARKNQHADLRPMFWDFAADRKLTALARFAADDALLRFDHDKWRQSPLREQLALECVKAVSLPREAEELVHQIGKIAQLPHLHGYESQEKFLAVIDAALSNDAFSAAARENIVRCIGVVPQRYDDDRPSYDWLRRFVRGCKDAQVQRGAAITLANMSLTPERIDMLRELAPTVQDDVARRHVQETIERGGPRRLP
jgi:hypothetical protein